MLLDRLIESAEIIEAQDLEEIWELAAEGQKSDVILYLAICSCDIDLRALKELMHMVPGTPVVVHTGCDDPAVLESMIEQGIAGIIPTSSSADVAVAALRLVAAGGLYIPSDLLQGMLAGESHPRLPETSPKGRNLLTRREAEVFEMIAKGMPNKEVALELGLAEATVKIHVQNIFKKLKVKNRTQAAYVAAQRKIQQPANGETRTRNRQPR